MGDWEKREVRVGPASTLERAYTGYNFAVDLYNSQGSLIISAPNEDKIIPAEFLFPTVVQPRPTAQVLRIQDYARKLQLNFRSIE